MPETPNYKIEVFRAADDLPAGAIDLFGNSIEEAWDMAVPEPAVIGAFGAAGEMVAGVFLLFDGGGGSRIASIHQLVVKPEHWDRGLAGRLLRRTMELAGETKCARVRSTAGWGCPDHLALYERLKFERAAASDRPYLVSFNLKKG